MSPASGLGRCRARRTRAMTHRWSAAAARRRPPAGRRGRRLAACASPGGHGEQERPWGQAPGGIRGTHPRNRRADRGRRPGGAEFGRRTAPSQSPLPSRRPAAGPPPVRQGGRHPAPPPWSSGTGWAWRAPSWRPPLPCVASWSSSTAKNVPGSTSCCRPRCPPGLLPRRSVRTGLSPVTEIRRPWSEPSGPPGPCVPVAACLPGRHTPFQRCQRVGGGRRARTARSSCPSLGCRSARTRQSASSGSPLWAEAMTASSPRPSSRDR